jgi:hypothetical protein
VVPDALDGALLLYMQFHDSDWIHRRVDRVEFMSDSLYRHYVSVDFDVQDAAVVKSGTAAPKANSRLLVPLGLMAKRPLTGFDLRDESGTSRPLLTSRETGEAAYQALLHLSTIIVGPTLSGSTQALLRQVASQPPEKARNALGTWFPAAHHTLPHRSEAAQLMADPAFKLVINELVDNFVALTPVKLDAPRQLVKYSYVSELPWDKPRLADRVFGTSARFAFPVLAAGSGYSYHFEVVAPEGLDLRRLSLSEAVGEPLRPVPGKDPLMRVEGRREQMHVHTALADRHSSHIAVADLIPQRRGLVRSAFIGVMYATVALISGYLWQHFTRRLELANVEALGAALLLVPGLAAVYVSRPGEHGMASRFAFGTRVATVFAAAAAVLGSISLALGLTGTLLTYIWLGLSVVAIFPAMYMWYVHRRAGQRVDYSVKFG